MGWHPHKHSCLYLLRTRKAWLWTVGRGWTTLRCMACLKWTCVWPLLKYWPVKNKLALTFRPFCVHHDDIYLDENWHMGECQPRSQQPCAFSFLATKRCHFEQVPRFPGILNRASRATGKIASELVPGSLGHCRWSKNVPLTLTARRDTVLFWFCWNLFDLFQSKSFFMCLGVSDCKQQKPN